MVDYLLDTNAIVALLNNEASIETILTPPNTGFIPIIAVGELLFGAEKSARVEANVKRTMSFIDQRTVLGCDIETANWYGKVAQRLRAKGRPIPQNDMWIAAIALRYDLTLMTKDEHFSVVEGLKMRGW